MLTEYIDSSVKDDFTKWKVKNMKLLLMLIIEKMKFDGQIHTVHDVNI